MISRFSFPWSSVLASSSFQIRTLLRLILETSGHLACMTVIASDLPPHIHILHPIKLVILEWEDLFLCLRTPSVCLPRHMDLVLQYLDSLRSACFPGPTTIHLRMKDSQSQQQTIYQCIKNINVLLFTTIPQFLCCGKYHLPCVPRKGAGLNASTRTVVGPSR